MARPQKMPAVWSADVMAKVFNSLEAQDVARAGVVCTRWHSAVQMVTKLRFSEDTFPASMPRQEVMTAMTKMILQADVLEDLDITFVDDSEGVPNAVVASWLLAPRKTLRRFRCNNIFSFEQMLHGARHETMVAVVASARYHTCLEHLALSGVAISEDPPLLGLPRLRSLELADVRTSTAALQATIASCKKLEILRLGDIDGTTTILVSSSTLQHVDITCELNGTTFDVHVDCPSLRGLRLAHLRLRNCHVAEASQLESLALQSLSGGPLKIDGSLECLKNVKAHDVAWQHISAVLQLGRSLPLEYLDVDSLADSKPPQVATGWARSMYGGSNSSSSISSSNGSLEIDEGDVMQDVPMYMSVDALAGQYGGLKVVTLGTGVWDRCVDNLLDTSEKDDLPALDWEHLSGLCLGSRREDTASFAAMDRLIRRLPSLAKINICAEIGPIPWQQVNPASMVRSPSLDSTFSGITDDDPPEESDRATGSWTSTMGNDSRHCPIKVLQRDPMTEESFAQRCGAFASKVMQLQRCHPKTQFEMLFRKPKYEM